jgi:tRNA(Ile)-lysidine synthetase-like protein
MHGSDLEQEELKLEEEIEYGINQYCRAHEIDVPSFVALVALSGGADSVALLLAMSRLKFKLVVCHVNHGQRPEALADEQFCGELCRQLGLTLRVVRLQECQPELVVGASEEALRDGRYRALVDVARDEQCHAVVTAHNLDDQVETLLFRLFRGTSPRGLAAMKSWRHLAFGIHLLRPMLGLKRRSILAYLGELGQEHREDASNNDLSYKRNFIRHQLMPSILEAFPEAQANVENFRRTLSGEDRLLGEMAEAKLDQARVKGPIDGAEYLVCSVLKEMDGALLARVLVLYMEERGVEPSFSRVRRFADCLWGEDRNFSFADGLELEIKGGLVRLVQELPTAQLESAVNQARRWMQPTCVRLPESGHSRITMIHWLNRGLKVETIDPDEPEPVGAFPPRQAAQILADLSAYDPANPINSVNPANLEPLLFRLREEGDFIVPLGMSEPVRLKQYLHANGRQGSRQLWQGTPLQNMDEKVTRRLTPVLACGREVRWVPGWGLSEKIKVQGRPSHRLSLLELTSG